MALGNKPVGTDIRRMRPFMLQSVPGGAVDHGSLLGLSDDDHTQYASADGYGSRAAYIATRLNRDATAGAGLTGGGTLTADISFAVGAGNGIAVNADDVAINLNATSGLEVDANGLALADSVAGAGLTIASKVLAVGAGTMITVNANDVQVSSGANYQFIGTGSGVAAAWRNVSELAGAGLAAALGVLAVGAGDGIDVAADAVAVDVTDLIGSGLVEEDTNNIALGSPSSSTVTSTNAVTTSSHTHAVTTSTNPGAAAAILASAADGGVQLLRLGIGADPDTNNRITMVEDGTIGITDGPILTFDGSGNILKLTGAKLNAEYGTGAQIQAGYDSSHYFTVTVDASGYATLDVSHDLLRLVDTVSLQAEAYVSQLTGWRITGAGDGDMRYLFVDELHAKAFIADLEQALAGGQIICKSVAPLAADFSIPTAGNTAYIYVKDFPGYDGMAVFQSGDIVCVRQFSRSGGELIIANGWGTVTAYSDRADGTQRWTFTRSAAPNSGTASGTISKDTLVLDYGTTKGGYWEVNAIDGAYGDNSPYAQVVSWTSHPAGAGNKTLRTRLGNLHGIWSVDNEYGLYAGSGITDSDQFVRISGIEGGTGYFDLHNLDLKIHDGTALRIQLLHDEGILINDTSGAWGSDTTTFAAVFANDATIGGLDANDVIIGKPLHSSPASQKGIHWDNSAGQMFIKGGVYIGDGNGYAASGALMHLRFDGPLPYESDAQVDVSGHLGQYPSAGSVTGTIGKFGKAAVFGVAATNLISNSSFESDTTGWASSWSDTLARVTNPVRFGSGALSVTASGGSASGAYCNVTVTAGQAYSVSAWVYVPSAYTWGTVQLRAYDGAGYSTLLGSTNVTERDQWQLVTVNNVTPATTTLRVVVIVGDNTADGNVFYVDGVQVEQRAYATWYGDGSRSACQLTYNAAGNINVNSGAVSCWVFPVALTGGNSFLLRHNNSGNRVYLYVSNTGYWSSGLGDTVNVSTTVAVPLQWHLLTLVWDGTNGQLFLDGVQISTYTYSSLTTLGSSITIGHNTSSEYTNGLIDDLVILDHAIDADEVRQIYEGNSPIVVSGSPFSLMLTGAAKGKVWGHAGGLFGQTVDGTASFALSNESVSLSWGGFTLAEGDMVLGHNKAGSAALFWDKSAGTMGFYGNASATVQVQISTSGQLLAGAGNTILDSNGITLLSATDSVDPTASVKWKSGATEYGAIYSVHDVTDNYLWISGDSVSGLDTKVDIQASSGATKSSTIALLVVSGTSTSYLGLVNSAQGTTKYAEFNNFSYVAFTSADARVGGGLFVGGTATDPASGDIWCSGLISTDSGTTKWELGAYTASVPTADGYVLVTINGSQYKLLCDKV